MKYGLCGFGAIFLPSNFPCSLLLLGGFFCPQSLRLLTLSLLLSPPLLPWLAFLSLDWVEYSVSDSAMMMVVKCLNTPPIELGIELGLGPILEAILEVEERIIFGHVAYLQHKTSELIDVVPNATQLLEAM